MNIIDGDDTALEMLHEHQDWGVILTGMLTYQGWF